MRRRLLTAFTVLVAIFAFGAPVVAAAHDFSGADTVYTMTNASAGNAVIAYRRAPNGTLSVLDTYPTGGTGTGANLASQGAVTLSPDGRWLAVVDAGSNDIALFSVRWDGRLGLADRIASGGLMPISVTIHGRIVYVLDAGGAGNIAGFVEFGGHLHALPGSRQPLSGPATSPEQISFNPAGDVLVVTEKGANLIVTYRVGWFGIAGAPTAYASAGAAPYGFAFDARGRMYVSEAAGSALSSYRVSHSGAPSVVTASVGNGQLAACWVALTPNGRFAFTIDAHNAAISSYAIAHDGSLTLADGVAVLEAGSSVPLLDAAVSGDGRFLYVVNVGAGSIDAFRIGWDGSLTAVGSTLGLPAGGGGLAAS